MRHAVCYCSLAKKSFILSTQNDGFLSNSTFSVCSWQHPHFIHIKKCALNKTKKEQANNSLNGNIKSDKIMWTENLLNTDEIFQSIHTHSYKYALNATPIILHTHTNKAEMTFRKNQISSIISTAYFGLNHFF